MSASNTTTGRLQPAKKGERQHYIETCERLFKIRIEELDRELEGMVPAIVRAAMLVAQGAQEVARLADETGDSVLVPAQLSAITLLLGIAEAMQNEIAAQRGIPYLFSDRSIADRQVSS